MKIFKRVIRPVPDIFEFFPPEDPVEFCVTLSQFPGKNKPLEKRMKMRVKRKVKISGKGTAAGTALGGWTAWRACFLGVSPENCGCR